MKLNWKGNQRFNEDISRATIFTYDLMFKMIIHKYVGCGDKWYFSCPLLGISCKDLDTEDINVAEENAMKVLESALSGINMQVNSVLSEFQSSNKLN